jgi:hypothetical protein
MLVMFIEAFAAVVRATRDALRLVALSKKT